MFGQLVVFNVSDDSPTPVPLGGTKLRVFSAVDIFLTELTTDVHGEADLVLQGAPTPGQTYIVRLLNPGWTFPAGATQQVLVEDPVPVGSSNIFDFTAHRLVVPESQDPYMCLMTGRFTNTGMQAMSRLKIRCMPVDHGPETPFDGFPGFGKPAVVARNQILSEIMFETDEDGYVEILLPRGGIYDVHIHGAEITSVPHYARIEVPDVAGINLEDVFFPYIVSLTFDPSGPATLHVGDSLVLNLSAIGSNLAEIPDTELYAFLNFTPSDPTIMSVDFVLDHLVVTALAPGVALVQATRKDNSYAVRNPALPDLVDAPPSITVLA
jgi:hypothetical protein